MNILFFLTPKATCKYLYDDYTIRQAIEKMEAPGYAALMRKLMEVSRIIAQCGGNVVAVHHERGDTESINGCFLRVGMETRNYEHVQQITQALRSAGFKLIEK